MAEEESQHFEGVGVDGNCNTTVGGSCFQILKETSFNEVNQHCSLDVVPILFEDGPFPVVEEKCGFSSPHGQDVYSISMLSEEGNNNPQCASQLAFLSFVELPLQPKNRTCLKPELDCQDFIDLHMDSAEGYPPCILDIDIQMESLEKPKSDSEPVGSVKSDGLPTGLLQRQSSLKSCGKFMQLLTNHGLPLLKLIDREKSFNERIHDASNNRWRKYKRAASFDSRKVVLLFSILSSLGTLILIYLTLRVRQTAEGFANA